MSRDIVIFGMLLVLGAFSRRQFVDAEDYQENDYHDKTAWYSSGQKQPNEMCEKETAELKKTCFWQKKLKTLFLRLDNNNDGFLTLHRFESIADRFDEMKNANFLNKKQFRMVATDAYSDFAKEAGEDGKVKEQVVIDAAYNQRCMMELFAGAVHRAINSSFPMLDVNGNGCLSKPEFIRMYYNIGLNDYESVAHKAFNSLDVDQNDLISFKEFATAIDDFFFSEDERRPGTYILGSLLED